MTVRQSCVCHQAVNLTHRDSCVRSSWQRGLCTLQSPRWPVCVGGTWAVWCGRNTETSPHCSNQWQTMKPDSLSHQHGLTSCEGNTCRWLIKNHSNNATCENCCSDCWTNARIPKRWNREGGWNEMSPGSLFGDTDLTFDPTTCKAYLKTLCFTKHQSLIVTMFYDYTHLLH